LDANNHEVADFGRVREDGCFPEGQTGAPGPARSFEAGVGDFQLARAEDYQLARGEDFQLARAEDNQLARASQWPSARFQLLQC